MKSHVYVRPSFADSENKCQYSEGGVMCHQQPHHHDHTTLPIKPIETARCPFDPHGDVVKAIGIGPDKLIEQHQITIQGKPMMCPASLMHWPLSTDEKTALTQQAVDLSRQVFRDIGKKPSAPEGEGAPYRGFQRTPGGVLHRVCGTYHHPGDPCSVATSQPLGGRDTDPGPRSGNWALGGRIDEDVVPEHEQVTGKVPPQAAGFSMGRGGMGSIAENARIANTAITNTEDAYAKLGEALQSVEWAQNAVTELLGDTQAETLLNWRAALNGMKSAITDAQRNVSVSNEFGHRFINNLYS